MMKNITVEELKAWRDAGREHQLIDIREAWEVEVAKMGGTHIPMAEMLSRTGELRRDVPVVLHCRSGGRSASMAMALKMHVGLDNLYNLEGGITAWAQRIDSAVEVY